MFVALGIYGTPYLKMGLAYSAHYSEGEGREYDYFTPALLRSIPRITGRYDFDFSHTTGPENQVHAINFYEIQETVKLERFLSAQGYIRLDHCENGNNCWQKKAMRQRLTFIKCSILNR